MEVALRNIDVPGVRARPVLLRFTPENLGPRFGAQRRPGAGNPGWTTTERMPTRRFFRCLPSGGGSRKISERLRDARVLRQSDPVVSRWEFSQRRNKSGNSSPAARRVLRWHRRHQPQRRQQPAAGQRPEGVLLGTVEFDGTASRTQQDGHHAVATTDVAGSAAVTVDKHLTLHSLARRRCSAGVYTVGTGTDSFFPPPPTGWSPVAGRAGRATAAGTGSALLGTIVAPYR